MSVRALFAFLSLLALAPLANGQNANATLTGIVRDPSQAPVAGARVRVFNLETNLERLTVSNESGNYTVPSLAPGRYQLEVEMSGFKKSVVSPITLEVAQQARADVSIEVGQVSDSVTVAAAPPLLETESNVIGNVVTSRSIVSIPLNGRNFMELVTLAGATNTGNNATSKNTSLAGTSRGLAPSVAGAPATENNYQLDGADNREPYFNSYGLAPSVDAVREFKIQVGQYSAEYGAGGGAVINVVTRSGTNAFHGTAFEFVRNDMFDARNTFLTPTQKISALRRNQFGVSVGGPVVIPKLYNGKDRTFIFGNFDLVRQRTASLRTSIVPTEAQRAGNMTGLNAVIDPAAGGVPFPNNVIPASRIDPISAKIVQWYPLPNSSALQNYANNFSGQSDQDTWLLRGDHRIANGHDFMVRYADQKLYAFTPGNIATLGGGLAVPTIRGIASGLTSTLSPTFVNELRFGWSFIENKFAGQNAGKPLAAQAGIPFAYADGELAGAPASLAFTKTTIGNLVEAQIQRYTNETRQFYDAVTFIRGSHNWKFGADVKLISSDVINAANANGNYTFSGDITGDGFGDFLLGLPLSSRTQIRPNLEANFRRHMLGFYAMDDWKVNSRLTLNIGLRYEYNAPPRELHGRTTQFDPSLGNGAGGLLYAAQNTEAIPFYQQFRPDLAVGLLNREGYSVPDRNNFAPRFGFAWRPLNRMVVRGGYGWYYSSAQWNNLAQNSTTAPPAQITADLRTSDIKNPDLRYDGIAGKPLTASVSTAPIGVITGPESKMLDGYTQQWSLSIARSLTDSFVVEAQYLGSKSTHLEQINEYNDAPTADSTSLATRVRFPQWARVLGFSSGATANYNALILNAEKRATAGLTFRGSFTWGKAMGGNNSRVAQGNIAVPQFSRNMQLETGRTTDDVTRRFVASYNWELPFGRGKRFGASMPRVLNALVGGISLSGIVTAQSGLPYSPGISTGNCNNGFSNACRPDLIGNFFLGGNGRDTPRLNRDAFDFPLNTRIHAAEPRRLGNAGVNIFENPGSFFWDMALMKDWKFKETMRLEFRWETFNTLNHVNYYINTFDPSSANFGRAFNLNGSPRIQQLGMKLYW